MSLQATETSIRQMQCPNCKENLGVGIQQLAPDLSFVLLATELEKRKEDFLELIRYSSMPEDDKSRLLESYSSKEVMLDPTLMSTYSEQIKRDYPSHTTPVTE